QEKGVGLLEITDEVTAFTEEAHRPLEPECAHARFNSYPLRSIPDQYQAYRDLPAHTLKHFDNIHNALDRAKGRYVKKQRLPALVATTEQPLKQRGIPSLARGKAVGIDEIRHDLDREPLRQREQPACFVLQERRRHHDAVRLRHGEARDAQIIG